MKRRKTKSLCYYLASFFLPILILWLCLLPFGISYQGSNTILASDGFHQYVIFAQTLRNILHGTDSLFYTFTSGLGLNFWALISYYLGSPLSPLVYFFDLQSMPDAIYLLTLLKFGLMGLSSYFSFGRIYPKIKAYLTLSLSISYSLMSFVTSQLELNSWLDVFIILPLILLGIHLLLKEGKTALYYFSLSSLFILNYYFGYMVAIFLLLYCLINLLEIKSWKKRLVPFFMFVIISLLSALTSSFMLIPTYLDLSSYGESFTHFDQILTDKSWYFDLLAKLSVGAYDTTKFDAIPMIYTGILPLYLSCLFFTLKSVSWQIKLAYGLLLSFIISSFYLQPLDLLWQGMHAPNMFLHRYSWTFSIIILTLAAKVLNQEKYFKKKQLLLSFTLLCLLLSLPYLFIQKYQFLQIGLFFLSLLFLTVYTLLFLLNQEKQSFTKMLKMFTLLFTCLELGINSSYQLSGINKEWVFPSREGYARHLKEIDSLVKGVSKKDKPFFRMERQIPQTGNDSMKFNYRGVSQFSSVRNRKSSSLLNRLGYRSDGTNLNLRYQNNTLLMDSLLSVKYNLSQQKLNKFGFHQIKKNKQTYLYQNTYDLPLGILTNTIYKDVNLSVNTLDNQTRFLNQLSGQEYTYFKLEPSRLTSNAQLFNQQVSSKAIHSNVPTIISYQVVVPNNKQLYVSLPNIQFTNPNSKNITIRVNNHAYHYTTDNAFSFFDLGYFQKQSTVSVDFIFPNNKQITVNQPHFYSLDINSLTTAIHDIKAKKVETVVQKNKIISHYHSKTKASLLFTIPYDKGWKAKLGKKSVPIQRAQDGFIKVAVPKGEGVLTLTFIPQGFILGISISFLSLLIYLLLVKRYCEVLSIKNVVRELI